MKDSGPNAGARGHRSMRGLKRARIKRLAKAAAAPDSRRKRPRTRTRVIVVACIAALAAGLFLIVSAGVEEDMPASMSFPDSLADVRASSPSFERLIALYTQTHFESGNEIELLLNGDGTFGRLWEDLRSAKRSIAVQTYFVTPGAVTDTLGRVLAERARAGVHVRVLLDAFGANKVGEAWRDSLRASGAVVAVLRPIKWRTIFGASNRSHVRAVTIDGQVAYAGGFGLADKWLGNGHAENQWRETNVRVRGPAAMQLQAAFGTAWFEAVGELIAGDDFLSRDTAPAPGTTRAGVLFTEPSVGTTAAQRFLALAIMSAERKLYIENSYFVPTAALRRLLVRAAQRGVDVRILTAGTGTDVPIARYAGRFRYKELTDGGVRMFEYQPAMLHAKTIVVDGKWTSVGSMNFDTHSLSYNDEANVLVLDSLFTARMESVFMDDLGHSTEITKEMVARRSVWSRIADWFASRLEHFL